MFLVFQRSSYQCQRSQGAQSTVKQMASLTCSLFAGFSSRDADFRDARHASVTQLPRDSTFRGERHVMQFLAATDELYITGVSKTGWRCWNLHRQASPSLMSQQLLCDEYFTTRHETRGSYLCHIKNLQVAPAQSQDASAGPAWLLKRALKCYHNDAPMTRHLALLATFIADLYDREARYA